MIRELVVGSCIFLLVAYTVLTKALPVIIYHGLGDNCCNEDIVRFIDKLGLSNQTTIVSLMIGKDPQDDLFKSYFDDCNRQVSHVCRLLRGRAELRDGFHAIGLSQGGLFLRAVQQRCGHEIKMRRLITLASPHIGVSSFPGCPEEGASTWCRVAEKMIESAVYSKFVQRRIVPAQYYREPKEYRKYLRSNRFLADLNQEGPRFVEEKAKRYKENLGKLEKFVLFRFANDTVLTPPSSAWFGYSDHELGVDLRQKMVQDTLGLDELIAKSKIEFLLVPGDHLQMSNETIREIAGYLV